jgi:alkaline phosphatase D
MRRRQFLEATLVTLGAAIAPAGCSDDEGTTPAGGMTTCELMADEAFFPQSVASGDPKPDSVILWTRVADPALADMDADVELEVAADEAFTQILAVDGKARIAVKAEAAFDHCVKVRLAGLSPATTYYYRFIYLMGTMCMVSRVGRTKTAPAPDADVKVKFAYLSCQDYIGRFYNTHLLVAAEDLDFVVHLGDYVYETTGDPGFQNTTGRSVKFTDEAGAIQLGAADKPYYAAKSLDNYRELYKTYRGDKALQSVHERFPMIATWDDHEFSDDCHGATASYFDGAKDETDEARRKAANQAWFEYMPVDYADPEFRYDGAATYPDDITIYRGFSFGKHMRLLMTDLRSYRADHLIDEGGFPGAVILDQAAISAALGSVPAIAAPYVDIEAFQAGAYKTALTAAAPTVGFDAAYITGKLSVAWINGVIDAVMDPLGPIDALDPTLEKGIAYVDVGKGSQYSSIGSRYLVIKDAFDVLAAVSDASSSGASSVVMGDTQEAWFLDTMTNATETWKVWGNEYCLVPLQVDVSTFPVPPSLAHSFYMNVDAWDGFREGRARILSTLSDLDNVVAITGDIHAFYAGVPGPHDDPTKNIVELVGSSVSSGTFKSLLESQVANDPVLSAIPLAASLAGQIDNLLNIELNPQLAYMNSKENGFVKVELDGSELLATYVTLSEKEVGTDYTGKLDELTALTKQERFKVKAGDKNLYKEVEGVFMRWDTATRTYV